MTRVAALACVLCVVCASSALGSVVGLKPVAQRGAVFAFRLRPAQVERAARARLSVAGRTANVSPAALRAAVRLHRLVGITRTGRVVGWRAPGHRPRLQARLRLIAAAAAPPPVDPPSTGPLSPAPPPIPPVQAPPDPPPPTVDPSPPAQQWVPPQHLTWQMQFAGTISLLPAVDAYDLDAFDTDAATVAAIHAQGAHAICYFSAGSYEDWRPDAAMFSPAVLGTPLDGWPGERWLDIAQLDALRPIMTARMDLCKQKGFDAVDPDNVDGYTNDSGFPLTAAEQLAYDRMLADEAHARGLAVGLKNDLDQVPQLVASFDFAVNEQCHEYDECDALTPFTAAGKPVIEIEYALATTAFCPDADTRGFMAALKHLSLDATIEPCWTAGR